MAGRAEAAQGERTSTDALFAMLYPDLRRFAAIVASPDMDPDDLVQEALARTLRSGPFSDIENPAAYLRQTIINLESSHRRRWARWREREHRAPMSPESTEAEYPSDLSVLQRIEPFDRALLYLAIVEDLPYAAIVDLLGGNEGTLRARASKARKRLRELLREEDEK